MTNDHLIKLKPFTALLYLFVLTSVCQAQSDPTDTPESVSESNIICYAAKNKWVCAPANEKEKAQEKAMKLALQQKDSDITYSANSEMVEIKTLKTDDIGQQVEEAENPIQSAIKDFIPRNDSNQIKTDQVNPEISNQVSETERSSELDASHNNEKQKVAASPPSSKSLKTKTAKTNFNQWQSMYAELWTFQVIGTSNRHHLDGFLLQHDLDSSNTSIVKTQANGADWWVVLSGLYNSREEALSQRESLPMQLSTNAWVRQIKTIEGQAD